MGYGNRANGKRPQPRQGEYADLAYDTGEKWFQWADINPETLAAALGKLLEKGHALTFSLTKDKCGLVLRFYNGEVADKVYARNAVEANRILGRVAHGPAQEYDDDDE